MDVFSITTNEFQLILTITLAAIVTYMLRFGGLLLADVLPKSLRFRRFMEALPGTILLSLVAPGILAAGLWGWVATVCVVICTYKTRNLFLSMLIGVLIVAIHRQISA